MSRIVFLLSQSLDSPSGLGRYGPLARELAKLGHKVDIFALHPAFDELDSTAFEIDGIQVHYVVQMHIMKSGDFKSYHSTFELLKITLRATWHLCRSALSTKADIVHIGKPHPMNSIAGLCARIINNSVLYLDCDDYEADSGRFDSLWQKPIISFFEKRMPHRVKSITTNTFFMRNKLLSWGVPAEKIIYIPNEEVGISFSAADLFIAPYIEGTQSGAVTIAIARGLPIVTTEYIYDKQTFNDKNTRVVPPRDMKKLAIYIGIDRQRGYR